MNDLHDALQRTLGSGFRIDREMGGGGMSRVFLATDIGLDRQVVVKVLSAELSAGVSADRFRREIQLVARLQHPHVVPVLSAGVAEGALYYVMPFISGEPLRARMAREGPMAVADAVRVLREVLDALSFAHAHGVIHRDIKPENILIGAGHAVVADFGVSKALQDSGGGTLTSVGIALGTPAYMAPEQAAADPATDHRADLYSCAVVAYEMLAGAPPFSGTPAQLLKAHIADTPTPLRQRRSDVPEAFAGLVMRTLAKEAAQRPQSASEMIGVLDGVTTPGGTLAAAAGVAAAPAVVPRRRRVVWIAAAAVVVLAAAAAVVATRSPVLASAQSLAITPFSVADGDTALVRLGQNLVTTMSANLDGVGEIRVADAMAVLSHARTKGALLSVSAAVDIARSLGARSVVHGTLVRSGPAVRADLSLYDVRDAATPTVRFAASLPIDSIGALTDSLTWGLLRGVWARGGAPTPNISSISTRSPVALREFLEGERLFSLGGAPEAAQAYIRAIEADTTFWFAHYRYRIAQAWFGLPVDSMISNRLGRHAAELPERERLLLLAVDSTTTQTARLRQLSDLIARNPDYTPALLSYGDYILHHGIRSGWDVRDALPSFKRIVQLMPSDLNMVSHLSTACVSAGDLECAAWTTARVDSLLRARPVDVGIIPLVQRSNTFTLLHTGGASTDSVAREARRDTLGTLLSVNLAITGGALADRPDRLVEEDRLVDLLRGVQRISDLQEDAREARNIPRGAVTAVDSLALRLARDDPGRAQTAAHLRLIRLRVLMEIQGLRTPSTTSAEEAVALLARPGLAAGQRIEARWIAAASGLWRGDSAVVRAQLTELTRDTLPAARTAARSLRALALGRSGNRAAAAESLLVIEREHGDRRAGTVWAAFAADRIVGAEWLAEAGRFAPADSLLRYTQGYPLAEANTISQVTYPAAQLLRSRIAEGMGDREKALRYARTFLVVFDKAPPEGQARIAEARERVARLSGTVEGTPPRQP